MKYNSTFVGCSALATALVILSSHSATAGAQSGSLVRLQPASPGTAQTGNLNISGNASAGNVLVNGRIGIGTTSPSFPLSIRGSEPDLRLELWNQSGGRRWEFIGAGNGSGVTPGSLRFYDESVGRDRMVLAPSGRVGIGSDAPSMSLQVDTPSLYSAPAIGGINASKWAYLHISSANHALIWNPGSAFLFGRESTLGAGFSEAARITSDGNFAVGTTVAIAKVDADQAAFDGYAILGDASQGPNAIGVFGATADGVGTAGLATSDSGENIGVLGSTLSLVDGWAVLANGDLGSSGTKYFHIDHPLDPAGKYLNHACLEGPEALNVYSGNVILDQNGTAQVTLPGYFGAINKDFRYMLTAVGGPGSGLYISKEIENNQFEIAGGVNGLKVSWQVSGVRNDAYAQRYAKPVEQLKSESTRGKYLHPELYGRPDSEGIYPNTTSKVRSKTKQP